MIHNILHNRSFTRNFHQEHYPEKELIEHLLKKTFELAPSKQCIMPYMITIFGPEFKKEKDQIIELSTRDYHEKTGNPNAQLKAPYVLIFSNRLVSNPNKRVKDLIKKGHDFKVCEKDKFQDWAVKKDVAIEIGMFSMILTTLAIENNIDTAYTLCQFNDPRNQTLVKNDALFIMSLGYRDRKDSPKRFKRHNVSQGEIKPNMEEVIIWK